VEKAIITDVFFDLDHTLYDFEKNSALTFEAVFKELNIQGIDAFMAHFKPINDAYWERFAREEITKEVLRYGRLKDTFARIGADVHDEHIYYIADYFIDNLANYSHVFEGTYEALDYLKDKYRLHIITNGPQEVQDLKLVNSKLDHYFITVTNSEKAGVKKPNPKIFELALHTAQTEASKSVMIGDNMVADVEGALNVGMQAVYFNEHQIKNERNFLEISKLIELKNIL